MRYLTLTILFLLGLTSLFSDGVQPNGSGTENDPYQIETLDNLLWLSTTPESWDSHFIQTATLTAADTQNWNDGAGFSCIGHEDNPFSGVYNGQDYTIFNLYINRADSTNVGMFGQTEEAEISNINISNLNVTGYDKTGGLIGRSEFTTVRNCRAIGNVTGNSSVGGLFGMFIWGSLADSCRFTGVVNGSSSVGGFVGYSSSSCIENCHSQAYVHGEYGSVGGFIGRISYDLSISSGSCSGSVSGDYYVGGFLGEFETNDWYERNIVDSYSSCNVHSSGFSGGFSGEYTRGNCWNCHYNYETVLLNGEHRITCGAVGTDLYNDWLANDLTLNVDDYFEVADSCYLINTFDDLNNMLYFAEHDTCRYRLMNDLDMESHPGFLFPLFHGEFDGNGHTISNLVLDMDNQSRVGFFSVLENSKVCDLSLDNIDVFGCEYVGGIAGVLCGNQIITDCKVNGTIEAHSRCGGCASNAGAELLLSRCSFSGSITGDDYLGGIIGIIYSSESSMISECSSDMDISGESYMGGFVGCLHNDATIVNSYFVGTVTEGAHSGNFIGDVTDGYIENCYSASTSINAVVRGTLDDCVDCFFNTDMSEHTYDAYAIGITTEEMRDISTYTDISIFGLTNPWDFYRNPWGGESGEDIWCIDETLNDGFPYLSWQTLIPEPVDDEVVPSLVTELQSIYPNPFNPETTISFSVATGETATIEIFNIRGQRVKSFDQFKSGEHTVVWHGTDKTNRNVASGVYFCRLQTGEKTEVRKLMLLK